MQDDLFKLLKSGNRLPSAPGIALRILELCQQDETSVADLADTISGDPALAGRILRFVNSPISGVARKVTSLKQAVSLLGMRGVKMISLSFSLVSASRGTSCPSFDFERFWSRSLAAAVSARLIARKTRKHDPEEAFIAGLLTRIGQLTLACGASEQYERVLARIRESACDILSVEQEFVGDTQAVIGPKLLAEWKLPEHVSSAVGDCCLAISSGKTEDLDPLAQILYAADLVASILCDPPEVNSAPDTILSTMQTLLGIQAEAWNELFEAITDQWREYGSLLTIQTGEAKSFNEILDEARLQMAELSLATQIENQSIKERNKELLQQSRTDSLTGIGNRAAFEERLELELERAQRTGRPVALLFADVDHFKGFNDTHGHQAGDLVLRSVAEALNNSARRIDFVARFGGEEFAIIAPECKVGGVASAANRLREAVEEMTVQWQGKPLHVTISIGGTLASWPIHPKTSEQIVAAADKQLYAAKDAGRNCCVVEPTGEPVATPA